MDGSYRRSTLALAVLSLLAETEQQGETAMHPYRMQQLIKARGKDQVVNVGQRASLYRTIDRLRRSGLIGVHEVSREGARPERTTYSLTQQGRVTWRQWMLDALATPTRDFPEFPAAIAFIPMLSPHEVLSQLEKRRGSLETELARIDKELGAEDDLPRLFMLEMEFLRATTDVELTWVTSIIEDLRAGVITWTEEQLRSFAEQASAPESAE
ncbi:PadR family transcriptional regulator [Kutzneria viridogrisea]|uniref:DNA-binding PadR family transcriptional regulator n=1 Tax=Kutzneria viridogrisea TaxID=47990 RepID=A0ABR6BY61_9PSEU|nr:DNA-binding PadR family transcriptional regulator [Kutzneria viridogrisea]